MHSKNIVLLALRELEQLTATPRDYKAAEAFMFDDSEQECNVPPTL